MILSLPRLVGTVVILTIISGFAGGAATCFLFKKPDGARTNLHIHSLDLIDNHGRVRAHLGTAADSTPFLKFLSTDGKEMVLLGIATSDTRTGTSFPAGRPLLQLNDATGNPSIHITTSDAHNAIIAFDSETSWSKLLIGRLDVTGDVEEKYRIHAWGMHIRDVLHETSIGIVEQQDADGHNPYITPNTGKIY